MLVAEQSRCSSTGSHLATSASQAPTPCCFVFLSSLLNDVSSCFYAVCSVDLFCLRVLAVCLFKWTPAADDDDEDEDDICLGSSYRSCFSVP